MLFDNWVCLQERVRKAARKAGRSESSITLVAVTKKVPVDQIREAFSLGIRQIGESRVQEAQRKREALIDPGGVIWHLIGSLQTNKVKPAVRMFDLIQSLDRWPLAETIEREASRSGKIQDCLVQVKVSEEDPKHGLPPEELSDFLARLKDLAHIRVRGLMAMAPWVSSPEDARPYFSRAYKLFEKCFAQDIGSSLILSMGMSSDFEVAIEEGANMVRVGTALFQSQQEEDT